MEGERGSARRQAQGAGGGLARSDRSAPWGHRLGLQKTLEDTGQALGQQRDCVCVAVCVTLSELPGPQVSPLNEEACPVTEGRNCFG